MKDQETVSRRHILNILLEDYFHVEAFHKVIQQGKWYRFETRFERNTLNALDLLDRFGIKATFFVLGWIADQQPELIREVARRGHEIASRGYYHRSIRQLTPAEFRDDLKRAREALENASGLEVLGYRAARRWSDPQDMWGLDVLAAEGYAYDASVIPNRKAVNLNPDKRFVHRHFYEGKILWEIPVSTIRLGQALMPIGGGNYFRQFPHTLVKRAVERWHNKYDAPFVMYFHVWELDPVQPRIAGASAIMKVRHYRNLHKMTWVLEDYFTRYRFSGIADYLDLKAHQVKNVSLACDEKSEARAILEVAQPQTEAAEGTKVKNVPGREFPGITIVVPCFNEELVMSYLANTLRSVEADLSELYDVNFILVDDGSTDATYEGLVRQFGSSSKCSFVRHAQNRGVAAAILTGIKHAKTEIVCSIDCDCTYDPHELRKMIPLLSDGVDMVTASPYHWEGEVRNVPSWRLALSKAASFCYRCVLRQKLHTYTSCFRVYRKSATENLTLRESGFLGVAEMLGRLDLQQAKIVEYPTTLEVRLFGRSKMKIVRTVAGHVRLLLRLLATRMLGGPKADGKTQNSRFQAQSSADALRRIAKPRS